MKKIQWVILTTIFLFITSQNVFAEAATTSTKDTPVVSAQASNTDGSWKSKRALGLNAAGYFELNSDWESLYFDFPANNIKTAGLGFGGFFDIGTSDKFSVEIDLGYSRLLYSDTQRSIINESYFLADLVVHYHFHQRGAWDIYGIGGAGAYISSNSVAPMINLGIGSYLNLDEGFYLKTEFIAKSAIILNRAEARIGLAYQF